MSKYKVTLVFITPPSLPTTSSFITFTKPTKNQLLNTKEHFKANEIYIYEIVGGKMSELNIEEMV